MTYTIRLFHGTREYAILEHISPSATWTLIEHQLALGQLALVQPDPCIPSPTMRVVDGVQEPGDVDPPSRADDR